LRRDPLSVSVQMTSKTWRYLATTYLVVYVVAIAIERHGLERGPMSPMDMILSAPILWGFAVHGIQQGSLPGRYSWVDRPETPFAFWIIVTCGFLYGLFLFCWGIRDALR
jgi:hypothetical protein